MSAHDVAYDAPLDMRSLSDATIHVTRRAEEFLVAGQLTINEAGLTTDIDFDDGLFAAITAPPTRVSPNRETVCSSACASTSTWIPRHP